MLLIHLYCYNEKALKCKPSVLIFGRGRAKKSHIALQGSCNVGIHVFSNHAKAVFVELALLGVRKALTLLNSLVTMDPSFYCHVPCFLSLYIPHYCTFCLLCPDGPKDMIF